MIKQLLREAITNIYENNVRTNLLEGPKMLFETVKDYYTMSGNHELDANNINELYHLLNEDGDFDPLGHGTQPSDTEVVDKNICLLSFSESNSKLDWPYLSLPAGYTCPFAQACKNFASKPGQKFGDGRSLKPASEKTTHMCYAARQQAQYPETNKKVFSNLALLMTAAKDGGVEGMANLIIDSIKYAGLQTTKIFRIHESGDFFSSNYMKAWIEVAKTFPNINFYTHTTSLQYWMANKASMPNNFNLIASMEPDNENFILQNDLRYSRIVYSVEEAAKLRLKIDYDDSIACCTKENFALLIHGQQPAGSEASKAVSANTKAGYYDKLKALHKTNKGSRKDLMK
jgi:hypothetical protein